MKHSDLKLKVVRQPRRNCKSYNVCIQPSFLPIIDLAFLMEKKPPLRVNVYLRAWVCTSLTGLSLFDAVQICKSSASDPG